MTIEASAQIELKAPAIKANATSSARSQGDAIAATLDGGADCTVKGILVKIN